jgi:hypothetical protein
MESAIDQLKVRSTLNDLQAIDLDIRNVRKHAALLRAIPSQWVDPRNLQNYASRLQVLTMEFDVSIRSLLGENERLSRRISQASPMQGHLANVRSIASRLPAEIKQLSQEVDHLAVLARVRMNDPQRAGSDPAAETRLNTLIGTLANLLDLADKWIRSNRTNAQLQQPNKQRAS